MQLSKNHLALSLVLAVLIVTFLQLGLIQNMIFFVLIGAVPGTSYSLSPLVMASLVLMVLWLITMYVASSSYEKAQAKKSFQRYIIRQQRFPRRRFARTRPV